MTKIIKFIAKKDVRISPRRYFVEAMGVMTYGLFSTLILGTIIRELGNVAGISGAESVAATAIAAFPFAVGAATAYGLAAPPLVIFAAAVAGALGNATGGLPGAFLAALCATEAGKLVSKETFADIIITPATVVITGAFAAWAFGPPIDFLVSGFSWLISAAMELAPFLMGAIVAILMGMALTSPISSAALAIALGLSGLEAGAAVAGCAANMIGFAASSYRENKIGGLLSQGLGTSMLQFPNIVKKPVIWLPVIIASGVAGVLSVFFGMQNIPTAAGMGTSGLVGQLGALSVMGYSWEAFAKIGLVHFLAPAVVALLVSEYMRKRGSIILGDMKI